MKKVILLSVFILTALFVYANDQRIVPIDSEIYVMLDLLSRESGQSMLSKVKPYSEAEVLKIIDSVEEENLSEAGRNAIERIRKDIEKTPVYEEENFMADVSLGSALELYLHTSGDESAWEYNYNDRKAFFSLNAEVWFNDSFYASLNPELKESRFNIDRVDADGNYVGDLTNLVSKIGEVNFHFPETGFFSFGGDNWNIMLGRNQLEYGNGETGTLLLSSYPDCYDFFRLKGFTDNFAFTWSLISLESWTDTDSALRYIADHALEVRLFDILTLSVNESALFYGEAEDLQFMSPLIVYHNLFRNNFITDDTRTPTGANICMTLGFNTVPINGIELYGEYLLDEFQTAQEQEVYGAGVLSTPNADAHILGLKASLPLGGGYLHVFFEYVYTSPWCYLLNPAGASMAWAHRETTDILRTRANVIKPLGYKTGPDTIAFGGRIGYLRPSVFDVNLNIDYVIKGENDITTAYVETAEAAQLTTPTGTPELKWVIGISGGYEVFDFFTVELNVDWVNISNYGHTDSAVFSDLQSALSLVFSI